MNNTPTSADQIAERAEHVRQRIRDAGGDPDLITLLAVSKTRTLAETQAAVDAGLVDLGENYAQEIEAKAPQIDGARWHMIGGLQSNKIKVLAPYVSLWQTVDRLKLGRSIASRAPGAKVLVQVNTSGEDAKSGCAPEQVDALVEEFLALGLDVRGLMTIGPTDTSLDPRPCFARLRELGDRLHLDELSMGMSGDIEAAVAEGTTMVRVGTALFGPR